MMIRQCAKNNLAVEMMGLTSVTAAPPITAAVMVEIILQLRSKNRLRGTSTMTSTASTIDPKWINDTFTYSIDRSLCKMPHPSPTSP